MGHSVRSLPRITRKRFFEALITIGGRFVSIILIVGTTKFLTTFLSEKDFGQLTLYNSIATLPMLMYYGPLGQGIMRFHSVAHQNNEIKQFNQDYVGLFSAGSSIIFLIGIISSIICWFFDLTNWSIAALLIAILNIFNGINSYRYGLQNMAQQRILSLALETGSRLFQQVLAVVLLLTLTNDPLVAIVGYCLASVIFFFLIRHYYQKTFPETILKIKNKEVSRSRYKDKILKYSWPFFLFGIVTWFQTASDRWALELMRSTEDVARYAVINQIGFQSLVLLFGSFSYFLFPILLNRAGNMQHTDQFRSANNLNNWYLVFNAIFCAAMFFVTYIFGPEIIQFFSSEQYVSESYLLPYMILAGSLFSFGQSYTNRYALSMQTQLLVYPKIISAIFGIVLNLIMVRFFHMPGVVAALIITQCLYVGLLIGFWKTKGQYNIDTSLHHALPESDLT